MLLDLGHIDKPVQCTLYQVVRIPAQTTVVSIRAAMYPVPAPVRVPTTAWGTTRRTVEVVALMKKRLKAAVGNRGKTYPFTAPVRFPAPLRGTTRRIVTVVVPLKKRLNTAVGNRGKRVISLPLSTFS